MDNCLLVFYIRFLLAYDPSDIITFDEIIENSLYILDCKILLFYFIEKKNYLQNSK